MTSVLRTGSITAALPAARSTGIACLNATPAKMLYKKLSAAYGIPGVYAS